ncbi:MAG TPA: hypothetical protein VIF09_10850 [Polyangiaceae bacterium]
MLVDLLVRFLLGGALVCAFAAAGEVFEPKSFAGLFGAAPSVALATLSLTFAEQGPGTVGIEARSMVLGGFALLAYGAACVVAAKRAAVPVWLAASGAWAVWLAVALCLWRAGETMGLLR